MITECKKVYNHICYDQNLDHPKLGDLIDSRRKDLVWLISQSEAQGLKLRKRTHLQNYLYEKEAPTKDTVLLSLLVILYDGIDFQNVEGREGSSSVEQASGSNEEQSTSIYDREDYEYVFSRVRWEMVPHTYRDELGEFLRYVSQHNTVESYKKVGFRFVWDRISIPDPPDQKLEIKDKGSLSSAWKKSVGAGKSVDDFLYNAHKSAQEQAEKDFYVSAGTVSELKENFEKGYLSRDQIKLLLIYYLQSGSSDDLKVSDFLGHFNLGKQLEQELESMKLTSEKTEWPASSIQSGLYGLLVSLKVSLNGNRSVVTFATMALFFGLLVALLYLKTERQGRLIQQMVTDHMNCDHERCEQELLAAKYASNAKLASLYELFASDAKKYLLQGNRSYLNNDIDGALEYWTKSGELNNQDAQYNLGVLYSGILGHKELLDWNKAVQWYTRAADQGFSMAQHNLGVIYSDSTLSIHDQAKAFRFQLLAAKQGDSLAMHNLYGHYRRGLGVEKDEEQAMYWLHKGAENGGLESQAHLGFLYLSGHWIVQDYNKAFYWFQIAAKRGHVESQYNLGKMYENGHGTEVSEDDAFYWIQRTALLGYPQGQFTLSKYYRIGFGTEVNNELFFDWFMRSLENGYDISDAIEFD